MGGKAILIAPLRSQRVVVMVVLPEVRAALAAQLRQGQDFPAVEAETVGRMEVTAVVPAGEAWAGEQGVIRLWVGLVRRGANRNLSRAQVVAVLGYWVGLLAEVGQRRITHRALAVVGVAQVVLGQPIILR